MHTEKQRQAARDNARERAVRLRDALFAKFGNSCKRCGFTDRRALQFDHISSDGGGSRRLFYKDRWKYYRQMLEDPDARIQVLCANCNWIKRHEQQEWSRPDPITATAIRDDDLL